MIAYSLVTTPESEHTVTSRTRPSTTMASLYVFVHIAALGILISTALGKTPGKRSRTVVMFFAAAGLSITTERYRARVKAPFQHLLRKGVGWSVNGR